MEPPTLSGALLTLVVMGEVDKKTETCIRFARMVSDENPAILPNQAFQACMERMK